MKTVFLRLFYKDLDKLNDQGIKAQVKEIILSVESSSKATEIKSLKKHGRNRKYIKKKQAMNVLNT